MSSVGTHAIPIVTQVVVDPSDPAFRNPNKFVGPVYGPKEAHALAESLGWTVKPDGEYFRRVVPSPPPLEILQIDAIRCLLEHSPHLLPIACGGGGVPVSRVPSRPETLQGVEAVIDKDNCGSKLSRISSACRRKRGPRPSRRFSGSRAHTSAVPPDDWR